MNNVINIADHNGNEFQSMTDFSQGCNNDVLYVKKNSSSKDLWEATISRMTAVKSLLEFGSVATQASKSAESEVSMLTDSALILVSDAISILNTLYGTLGGASPSEDESPSAHDWVYILSEDDANRLEDVKDIANMLCDLSGRAAGTGTVELNSGSFCSTMGRISDNIGDTIKNLPRMPLSVAMSHAFKDTH